MQKGYVLLSWYWPKNVVALGAFRSGRGRILGLPVIHRRWKNIEMTKKLAFPLLYNVHFTIIPTFEKFHWSSYISFEMLESWSECLHDTYFFIFSHFSDIKNKSVSKIQSSINGLTSWRNGKTVQLTLRTSTSLITCRLHV